MSAHEEISDAAQRRVWRSPAVDEAIWRLRAQIQANPGDADAWAHLGAVLLRVEPQESLASCRKAVALDPGSAEAWCILGVSQGANDDKEGAMDAFREAVRLDPEGRNGANAWGALGRCLLAEGRREEAEAAFRKPTGIGPSDGWAWLDLGYALKAMDDREGAISALRRARDLMDPDLWSEAVDDALRQLEGEPDATAQT